MINKILVAFAYHMHIFVDKIVQRYTVHFLFIPKAPRTFLSIFIAVCTVKIANCFFGSFQSIVHFEIISNVSHYGNRFFRNICNLCFIKVPF